jgi:YHS domain-containing protein
MRLVVLFGCLLAAGCGTPAAPVTPTAAADADVPPAFRNDQGKLACPVMGDVVESPEKSAGHLDHAGVRYYFCCNSCQVMFEDDPEKYVDGRYLKELGKMSGGTSDVSACEPSAEP